MIGTARPWAATPRAGGAGARCLGGWRGVLRRAAVLWCASGVLGLAGAQGVGAFGGGSAPDRMAGPPERSVAEWLVRLQQDIPLGFNLREIRYPPEPDSEA